MRGKNSSGVITIFVSLLLSAILSVDTLVIEAARLQAARNLMTDSAISTGTSMLAAYNRELYERYGLLAMDADKLTEQRAMDYMKFNADEAPGYVGNNPSRLYSVKNAEVQGLYNLADPAVLKRQILSRARYHVVPEENALNHYNLEKVIEDTVFSNTSLETALASVAIDGLGTGSVSDISPEMQEALDNLYKTFKDGKNYDEDFGIELAESDFNLLPSQTKKEDYRIPSEDLELMRNLQRSAQTLLGESAALLTYGKNEYRDDDIGLDGRQEPLKDMFHVPEEELNLDPRWAPDYAVAVYDLFVRLYSALNGLSRSDRDGNLLLNSYIASYFSNRNQYVSGYAGPGKGAGETTGENFAAACTEYIFGGSRSEKENQETAYYYIFAIRFRFNLETILANTTFSVKSNCYSMLAHMAWAYFETCCDMELMTTYHTPIPLHKSDLILDIRNPNAVSTAFKELDFVGAMRELGILDLNNAAENYFSVPGEMPFTYRDYLAWALWYVPNSVKLLRVADLIQLEMRYREKRVEGVAPSFLMREQNTFCRIKCEAELNSLLPVLSLGREGGLNRLSISEVRYVGF